MAEFRHYVCWTKERAFRVLNLEAERADRPTFLAVHSDHPLKVVTAAAGDSLGSHGVDMIAEDFVARFLLPEADHVQSVIVGDSGTGKSHFIKWLSMRVEETPERIVLTIPKSGTSLRRIVEMILDRLPPEEATKHRAHLEIDAFENDTPANKRRRLAAYIALELGNSQPTPGNSAEAWLLEDRLRLLFSDVHIVDTQLAIEGGIIDRLIDHVGERRGVGASDLPHEFTLDDLPRAAARTKDAAAETRAVLSMLAGDESTEGVAVALVNRVLGAALSRALAFSPDRLIEVMAQLRRHLAHQGKELVLLIEDFARLQGIDGGLMQALIEAGGGESELCRLRWCMAITTGPYESVVRSTLKTRLDLVVDMTQTAAGFGATTDELTAFTVKYLNAARVSATELADWATGSEGAAVPNACDRCEFQTPCHAAFGNVDGVGLYPFTREALPHMLEMVDADSADRFNPRQFIKGVLKPTLADHIVEWQELKSFPSPAYHAALGGPDTTKIDSQREQWIERTFPVDTGRWTAFLDLWADKDLEFDPAVANAFGLAAPPTLPHGPVTTPQTPTPSSEPHEPPSADQRLTDALNEWGRGEPLQDWATTRLRSMVFDAIETAIDWDDISISPGFFLRGDAKAFFKPAHISFEHQSLATMPGEVQLHIPASDERTALRQASIALQALVTLRSAAPFRHGYAPDGIAQFGAHLSTWAESVTTQLRGLAHRLGPLEDACELLMYRAMMNGHSSESPASMINAAIDESDNPVEAPSQEWQSLLEAISEESTNARAYVRALTSASKGGAPGGMIDPRPMLEALQRIRRNEVRDDSRRPKDEAHAIPTAVSTMRKVLPSLVTAEASRQIAWGTSYREQLGRLADFAALRALVTDLRQELIRCGVPFSKAKGSAALDGLERLTPSHVDREVVAIEGFGPDPDKVLLSDLAAPERWAVIRDWRVAYPAVCELLDEVEASVAVGSDIDSITASIEKAQARIGPLLSGLVAAATALETGR